MRGALDDPDRDGLTNLLEYALGLDPSAWSAVPPRQTITDASGSHLAFIFTRPSDRIGVTLAGEVTSTLGGTWLSGSANVGQSVQSNGDGTETVTIWDKTPISAATQRFLRLRVTQP